MLAAVMVKEDEIDTSQDSSHDQLTGGLQFRAPVGIFSHGLAGDFQ